MKTSPLKIQHRIPVWLRRTLPERSTFATSAILQKNRLNTVCESAKCPNRSECYSRRTATFMILGNVCTRRCGFCAVETGKGEELLHDEPERVAQAAAEMDLEYIVITSVARDDLKDEGAAHFAQVVRKVREKLPHGKVEVLTPDFHARRELIERVMEAGPVVYNHNIETVARLQKAVRPQASYERSLEVLRLVKDVNPLMPSKSGMMLGLGETQDEVLETAQDLRQAGVDILVIGQYLRPTLDHLPVIEYIAPSVFGELAVLIKHMGFKEVFSGAYVRSSYHAGVTFLKAEMPVV